MDNLPLLRDIHLPEPVFWVPLGYGVLIFAGLVLAAVVLWPVARFLYRKTKKYYALNALKNIKENGIESVVEMSVLLKRVCLLKHKSAAVLFSKPWVEFLNAHTDFKLTEKQEEILSAAPYMAKNTPLEKEDFEALKKYAQNFLEKNL